jgi:hypothetical protein
MIGLKRAFQETGPIHILNPAAEPGPVLSCRALTAGLLSAASDLMPLVDFDYYQYGKLTDNSAEKTLRG